MEPFQSLLSNAALLIVMGFAYVRIFRTLRQYRLMRQLFNGIIFGWIAVIVMLVPKFFSDELFFDTRSIVISISGLFGGPVTAAVSILIASTFRIYRGGVGAIAGVAIILSSGAIGIGYYYLRRKYPGAMKPLYVYFFGLLVQTSMFLSMLLLPRELALKAFEHISLSLAVIFPLVSYIIVFLLLDKEARIKAEGVLAAREKQYSTLLNNLSTGIVIHAPDTGIIFNNPRASQLLGLTQDQMHGRTAVSSNWHFVTEDGSVMPEEQYPVNQVLNTLHPLTGNIIGIKRAKNDLVWVWVNAFPEFDPNMQNYLFLNQIVVSLTDITKNKQTHEALKESEEKLSITLNSIGDGVIVTDTKALITRINPEAERLTGWKAPEACGKPLESVLSL